MKTKKILKASILMLMCSLYLCFTMQVHAATTNEDGSITLEPSDYTYINTDTGEVISDPTVVFNTVYQRGNVETHIPVKIYYYPDPTKIGQSGAGIMLCDPNKYYISYNNYGYNTRNFFLLNPATGIYEPYTDIDMTNAFPVGQYKVEVTMVSSIYRCDSYTLYKNYYLSNPTVTFTFNVTPKDINTTDISIELDQSYSYTGEELHPTPTVSDTNGDIYYSYELIPNIEYSIEQEWNDDTWEYEYYDKIINHTTYDYTITWSNNVYPGNQATITITGTGNYTGTRTATFSIYADMEDLTYGGIKNCEYNGKARTPGITISCVPTNLPALTLVPNVDYTLSYSNNIKYGEATITITGMGFYTGTYEAHFGIVPKKVTGLKVTSPKEMQNKITWKTVKGAQGYLIERYNSKKKEYEVIGTLRGQKWQVFYDGDKSLKKNKKYKYRVSALVFPSSDKDNDSNYYYNSLSNAVYYAGKGAAKSGKVTTSFKELNVPILTGNINVDYAAEVICKKVIKKGMTQQEKVKALYNWVVNNCTHNKDYGAHKIVYKYSKNKKKAKAYAKKMKEKIYKGTVECNYDGADFYDSYEDYEAGKSCSYMSTNDYYNKTLPYGDVDGYGQFDRAYTCFQTHKGGCSYITRLFKVLVNHAGIECTLVDGAYINRDGSQMYHYWVYIRTNKKYAWYDVDVATSNKGSRYHWYKRNTKFWKTCHSWDPDAVPRGIPKSLLK